MDDKNRIGHEIVSVIKDKDIQEGLLAIAQGFSAANPCVGVALGAIKGIITITDEIKIRNILKGLSSGLNVETYTNELTSYVSKNEDNAFRVADTLRKALLSDSTVVCVLMGRILGDHINRGARYDYADRVVVHALESAIDEDIITFRKMVSEIDSEGKLKVRSEFDMCIDWCISNRLGRMDNYFEDGTLSLLSTIKFNESAFRLKHYIEEVKQIFRTEF